MVGPPLAASRGRGRQAFSEVNSRQDVTATSDVGSGEGSECGTVEFTKEEVEALLNEKLKGKKLDPLKVIFLSHEFWNLGFKLNWFVGLLFWVYYLYGWQVKLDNAIDYIKRLKLCLKWFQQVEQNHVLEKEKLQSSIEAVEKKCTDTGTHLLHCTDINQTS